jgi:hypothetical protein
LPVDPCFAADSAFAQVEPTKPAKSKRVFTNDDPVPGEKYAPTQRRYSSSPKGTSHAGNLSLWLLNPRPPPARRAQLGRKLKEAETALQKPKQTRRNSGALEKSEQKHREARTDFQKNLTQNQVADSKQPARATEEVKQAEEKKQTLEAEQKGFKPNDLGTPEVPAEVDSRNGAAV